MHSNKQNPDRTPVFKTSELTLVNVDEASLVKFYEPLDSWLAY